MAQTSCDVSNDKQHDTFPDLNVLGGNEYIPATLDDVWGSVAGLVGSSIVADLALDGEPGHEDFDDLLLDLPDSRGSGNSILY